ncbi:HupE/UreJ family protein [Prosthecomicrobium sp. N25]|uniref:HupE/UreJ family protein n=1 Tax=Prosthecomicrobium sp. N25 TaxID=3129254 RepID=UPI00307812EB
MKRFRALPLAAILVVVAGSAGAHPGHEGAGGLVAGLSHPVLGLDHVLAMVAVGLLGQRLGGLAAVALPAAFVTIMLAGGALEAMLPGMPLVETGVLASVVVLGIAAGAGRLVPAGAALALVAVFAVLHGAAHGAEAPAEGSLLGYFAGFALATAALHGLGYAGGLGLGRLSRSLPATAGYAIAALGAGLAAGAL